MSIITLTSFKFFTFKFVENTWVLLKNLKFFLYFGHRVDWWSCVHGEEVDGEDFTVGLGPRVVLLERETGM